jgi:hypothetical protein
MPRKSDYEFSIEDAKERVMAALDKQTEELSVYPSTPHTAENQGRILSTIEILDRLQQLED